MPTGRKAARAELESLVALARRHRFLLVNDNPYGALGEEPLSILSIEGADEVALELSSLSKTHNMAGWRIGWIAGNASYVDAVLRVRSNADSGMFLPIQRAATEALSQPASWLHELRAVYDRRRRLGEAILRSLGCAVSGAQEGVFVWAKAPGEVANVAEWLDEVLHETNVFITPGFVFGEGGARFVRLSLCAPDAEMREAAARISRIAPALREGKVAS
jgi:aspartate/methionine/tyrosine aminotransferase